MLYLLLSSIIFLYLVVNVGESAHQVDSSEEGWCVRMALTRLKGQQLDGWPLDSVAELASFIKFQVV